MHIDAPMLDPETGKPLARGVHATYEELGINVAIVTGLPMWAEQSDPVPDAPCLPLCRCRSCPPWNV